MNETPKPSLVTFPGNNINDLPARLRSLAEKIETEVEAGRPPETFLWVSVTTDGQLEAGALGRCHSPLHAVGFLQAASIKLATKEINLL